MKYCKHLCSESKVLILDELAANFGYESNICFILILEKLKKERTTCSIEHRLTM